MADPRQQAAGLRAHDHALCRREAEARAEALTGSGGLNLTPVRRRVFDILLESHVALGAYDILRRLTEDGRPAQPPAAYRALDHLMAHGLVHKIEGLNAYVACTAPHHEDGPAFMVCRVCRTVAEAAAAPRAALESAAESTGFTVERTVIEALGVCAGCRAEEGA